MKKIKGMLFLVLLLTMVMTTGVYADEVVDSLNKVDIEYSTKSLNYIENYSTSIRDMADGDIYISTSTSTTTSVDYLSLYVELQKKVGTSWVTVKTWGTIQEYNSNYISYSAPYEGEIGSKYRVITTHSIKENGVPEVVENITDPITLR